MSKQVEYKDLIAFHPGSYVEEIVENLNITPAEFADRAGMSSKTISKIISGEEDINKSIASNLAKVTGVSVQTWLNLQKSYDAKVKAIEDSLHEVTDDLTGKTKLPEAHTFTELKKLLNSNDELKMYYSVCQYIPDPIRHEALNVGMVFHIPQLQYSKFFHSKNTKRLTSFDKEADKDFVKTMYESLGYVFNSPEGPDDNFSDIAKESFLPARTKYYVNTFRFLEVKEVAITKDSFKKDIEDLRKTFLY